MRFYEATRFLFPRHYERRIMAICFGAIHLPLIGYILFQSWRSDWDVTLLGVLLAMTLVGTIIAIMAITALLAPIQRATAMLRNVQGGVTVETIPVGGEDLVGRLLHGVAHAASETARHMKQLKDAAERDVLTGLRNRRGFLDTVGPMLFDKSPATIALLDIDRFKAVNDEHGHDRGDQLLTDFADSLVSGLRRSDISARWGGEEFIVFFPDTAAGDAAEILERLQQDVQRTPAFRLGERVVSFSCGIASVAGYADLAPATRRADQSLYKAKTNGRSRILIAG